jgi:predicted amidohydrolase
MMPDEFTVSLIQLSAAESDARLNTKRAIEAMNSLAELPDAILLPELWTGSRADGEAAEHALAAASGYCAATGVYAVCGTMPWTMEDGAANRAWMLDGLGRNFAFYDKVHLSSRDGEGAKFKPGSKPAIFDANGVTCAVLTGYDMLFPEFHRPMALAGAEVFFVPSMWRDRDYGIWEIIVRAVAAWNQVFVVACNRAPAPEDGEFFGNSMAVSPGGEVLGRLGREEGSLSVSLDLREIKKNRRNLSLERDRRSDIYTILS